MFLRELFHPENASFLDWDKGVGALPPPKPTAPERVPTPLEKALRDKLGAN